MPAKNMAEYMANRRTEISVQVDGKMLTVNKNDMLTFNKILLKVNRNELENLLTVNGFLLKVNTNLLKVNKNENSQTIEICEKTPFLTENSARVGGVGGGFIRKDDVTCNLNKEKRKENILKENFSEKFSKEEKRKYMKELGKLAFPYWAVMPLECRQKSSFKKFTIVFMKVRKNIPGLDFYTGVIASKRDVWNEGFFPAADKLLDEMPWHGLSAREVINIRTNIEQYREISERLVQEFNKGETP